MSAVWKKAIELGCARSEPFCLAHPQSAGTGKAGLQRGHLAGSSLDFKDHRDYQPGDDLRHIDWNSFARTDRLTLKLYHEEIMPHLDLCLDVSRSMALPNSRKEEASLALSAFFANAAGHAGYSHTLSLAGDHCLPKPDGDRPPILWSPFLFNHQQPPHAALSAHTFKRHGVRIFISDLLWPGDPQPLINVLSRDAASLLVVQVLAKQDIHLQPGGKMRLEDSETGTYHEILMDATTVKRYSKALDTHNALWRNAAQRAGAVHTLIEAESFLDQWQFDPEVLHSFLRVRGG